MDTRPEILAGLLLQIARDVVWVLPPRSAGHIWRMGAGRLDCRTLDCLPPPNGTCPCNKINKTISWKNERKADQI